MKQIAATKQGEGHKEGNSALNYVKGLWVRGLSG
jgi:hypothetical protein